MWGTIEKSILETAMKHISKKKICNTKSSKINRKRPRLDKIIVELSRWVKYARKKVGNEITEKEKEDFEKFKENIKKKYQVELGNIDNKWEEKDVEDLRGWKRSFEVKALGKEWSQEYEDIATKVWKYNLACLVLMRLNMMQLSLKPDQRDWGLIEKGQRVASVLGKSFTFECTKTLRNQNLYFTQQLLDIQGRRMLTWHQLRTNRGLSCKGRKAKWFTLVEKKLLKKERSREVKLLVAKENSRWDVRRVVRKEQGTILMEHWVQELQNETTETIVEKYESCDQNRLEMSQSCEEQTERSDIVGVLPTKPHGNGKRKLDLNVGAVLRWGKRWEVKEVNILELPQRYKSWE
ncbi:23854_t:CDS:2 [Gigaspora rosea]|nr:23854_t:CDS:2 [Gigaspora rosea]